MASKCGPRLPNRRKTLQSRARRKNRVVRTTLNRSLKPTLKSCCNVASCPSAHCCHLPTSCPWGGAAVKVHTFKSIRITVAATTKGDFRSFGAKLCPYQRTVTVIGIGPTDTVWEFPKIRGTKYGPKTVGSLL